MNKIESRYDLYQWLKVARAIKKLKADIGLGIGALQERIAMNGEVSELIYQLKEKSLNLTKRSVGDIRAKDLSKSQNCSPLAGFAG